MNVLTLPYTIARLPWTVLDGALAARLPDDAPPRLALDRILGAGDQLAGRLLHDSGLLTRGEERLERSGKITRAVRLETEAEERRAQAREAGATAVDEAARKRREAQETAEAGLHEAQEVEAQEKRAAAEAARQAAARKKAAADKRAAARKLAVDQREQQTEAQAEATVDAAHRIHEAAVHDASEKKSSAAEARADAARLEDLTKASKDRRKAE